MLVALTVWNGRISPVFDVARHVLLVDVEDGKIVSRREEALPGAEPDGQVMRIVALEARELICGAISRPLGLMLAEKGVRTIPFIAGDAEEIIAAYLAGALPTSALAMPGCCGKGIRFNKGSAGRCRRGRWLTAEKEGANSEESSVTGDETSETHTTSIEE